jgi:hypothetical protein
MPCEVGNGGGVVSGGILLLVDSDRLNAPCLSVRTVPDRLILRFTKTREKRAEELFAVDVMA